MGIKSFHKTYHKWWLQEVIMPKKKSRLYTSPFISVPDMPLVYMDPDTYTATCILCGYRSVARAMVVAPMLWPTRMICSRSKTLMELDQIKTLKQPPNPPAFPNNTWMGCFTTPQFFNYMHWNFQAHFVILNYTEVILGLSSQCKSS